MAESADKDSRWYFTTEQLQNSPSRKCGIDADKELVYRQQTAYLIQEMGQSLRVSQLCINTAIVYMHRFYAFHSFSHFNRHRIAAASLFLAAKVEEQPRKLEHVIRVAFTCLNIEAPDPSKESFSEQAQDLVFNENVLLQTLGFDVAIDHPHTHVVKTCHLVRACKDLAQTSYFMASNSLHLTTMCLQYKPTVVACFCIHLACRWSNWDIPHSSEGLPWFHYVDKSVTKELLTQLTEEFLQIYEKSPSRLKNKLNSIKTLAQSAKTDDGPKSGSSSSQERSSNHHRTSMSHSHHHAKQTVDPNNPKAAMPSSSRQQQYQMHHQGKSRDRLIAPPRDGQNSMKNSMAGKSGAIQSSSSHNRVLPPPRDAFSRESGKSRPSFPHHSGAFPHHQQKKESFLLSSAQSSSKPYFGDPTRTHPSTSNLSQGMRYGQNSHKHSEVTFSQSKNSLGHQGIEEALQNKDVAESVSPKHPQKSIFSPDQPEKVDVVKKAPPPMRFDERRDMKKEKKPDVKAPVQKVATVKPMTKHPSSFGGPPYKSATSSVKRSFDEMTRHEDSGIDFREAKMRRSEAENESRARAGKMDNMSSVNPLNLGGSFNAFDTTFDQHKGNKTFPPSLANSIETNPDLVSCLLKESLSENKFGSALSTVAGGGQEKPSMHPAVQGGMEGPIVCEGVTLTAEGKIAGMPCAGGAPQPATLVKVVADMALEAGGDVLHHKSKSEKKKKKDKHKHKEKDKSKDREERKKHKKDKERERTKDDEQKGGEEAPVTVKFLPLPPRDKGSVEGGTDSGVKLKIPRDRIRTDLSAGHIGYDNSMPSVELIPEKPSSSLKIKISKDKIENFSDGSSFAGPFAGGKKKDKDKDKPMKYPM
ncbi:cyclin-T isoform X2 [Phlebotomus argentipes]|uniref:cyclin-T isoform X2 n=1 Tax=Phlebotomus argentipes TaxID=94469 RepID=UPI002892A068|nr:cyclin-T isoform X2 [Phlebotomus argentipes]